MTIAELKKYKDNCYAALSRDLVEFEKNFLLISAGILAFSTSFIKEVISIAHLTYLYALFMSWVFIIAAIGFMMHTFLKSANASDKLWFTVNDFMVSNKYFKDSDQLPDDQSLQIKNEVDRILKKSKRELKRLRTIAVWLFLIGIFSLAFFVFVNLVNERKYTAPDEKSLSTSTSYNTNLKSKEYEQINTPKTN